MQKLQFHILPAVAFAMLSGVCVFPVYDAAAQSHEPTYALGADMITARGLADKIKAHFPDTVRGNIVYENTVATLSTAIDDKDLIQKLRTELADLPQGEQILERVLVDVRQARAEAILSIPDDNRPRSSQDSDSEWSGKATDDHSSTLPDSADNVDPKTADEEEAFTGGVKVLEFGGGVLSRKGIQKED